MEETEYWAYVHKIANLQNLLYTVLYEGGNPTL